MPKKQQKLNNLKQAHAKIETTQPTSLDQVWGFNETSRFETLDESVYKNRIDNMTRVDLENHARSIGVMVLENSDRLKDALLKQFRAFVLSLNKPISIHPGNIKVSVAAQKVLNEGR